MIDSCFYNFSGPLSVAILIDGLDVIAPPESFLNELIEAPAGLSNSSKNQLCFLDNKRRKDQLITAKASACFVTDRLAPLVSERHITPIISKTPRAHFARAASRLYTVKTLAETGDAKIAKTAQVHKTTVIGAGVIIDEGVIIEPYSVIGPGVKIGAGTFVGTNVNIQCAVIGENCRIKSGAVIGGAGFGVTSDENGLVDIPHFGRVVIGDRVCIGSQTCVDRGQLDDTILENDVKIDNLVQIAHNCRIGAGTVIAGHVGISGSCTVGKGVQMGGNVGLADHLTIGDGASIAARAGVMHNIPAGEVWSGIPAMPIREHMRLISATRKLVSKPGKD